MPWEVITRMSARKEFVELVELGEVRIAVLCRRFGISRKTGYKWIQRFKDHGTPGLSDRSRRPLNSPRRAPPTLEDQVVQLRQAHRAWGGRKITRRLMNMGHKQVCSPSTVTAILHRHHLIDPLASEQRKTPVRFEYPAPNDLWQMDFKGHFPLNRGGRCHPLTVLDDHSRYAVLLRSCSNEQSDTVAGHLQKAFETYGLPRKILCDNGPPWGNGGTGGWDNWTRLSLWLLRLGVRVVHGRPYHPQTQGKDERFHATLVAEVLRWQSFDDLEASQKAFDPWRMTYNTQRPHEALEMQVPVTRYHASPRSYPSQLTEIIYPTGDLVRKVSDNHGVNLHGKRYGIGRAFRGQNVALRATATDGLWDVYYCHEWVGSVNEKTGESMSRVRRDPLDSLAQATPEK